jgi:hypothetical protein
VPVRVVEVQPATAVIVVDLPGRVVSRVGVELDPGLLDSPEDGIELILGHQERIVLWGDPLRVAIHEIQGHAVTGLDRKERAKGGTDPQPQNHGQEVSGFLPVASLDDGVVQLDGHLTPPTFTVSTYPHRHREARQGKIRPLARGQRGAALCRPSGTYCRWPATHTS